MKKILVTGLLMLIAGIGVGYYMWNKPHKNISKAKPAYELTSDALVDDFQNDENSANTKFLGKVIEVTGTIKEVAIGDDGGVQILLSSQDLLSSVSCSLQEQESDYAKQHLKTGDQATIKGVCTGFLMDVVLERCVITKKN